MSVQKKFTVVVALASIAMTVAFASTRTAQTPASQPFDVNDLAFLWPLPENSADVSALISGDILKPDGSRVWPAEVFALMMRTAQETTIEGPARVSRIDFEQFKDAFEQPSTWKLVGFRVDPSAPGGHARFVSALGSTPQLRLIFQPVTVTGGSIKIHDVAGHLAYSFVKPNGTAFPAVPDTESVKVILDDLKALKAAAAVRGITTAGPLRVHPAIQASVPGFASQLRAFLGNAASRGTLSDLAFMGIEAAEPWIFFAMRKSGSDGTFEKVATQMMTARGAVRRVPESAKLLPPVTANLAPHGTVATAPLLRLTAGADLEARVFPDQARPVLADIPDIIANPNESHVLNTDCISCHTETTRRTILKIAPRDGKYRYERPAGVSGVDEKHLPTGFWNLRNFGWFASSRERRATISQRTANEAAEAADFANRHYFESPAKKQ